jgi:hypothetical protein
MNGFVPLRAPAVSISFRALLGCLLAAGTASAQTIDIHSDYPRLTFRPIGTPAARSFQDVRDLYATNPDFRNEADTWLNNSNSPFYENAAKYVITGDLTDAEAALNGMVAGSLTYTGSNSATKALEWAFAYDWIHDAWEGSTPPAGLEASLADIEGKIASYTGATLSDLDSSGPSLWHGRAALGASAWVTSVVLPAGQSAYDGYRSRAWNHWQQTLKATHASGGWPEGPTYWATSRGPLFPAAVQAYQNAVVSAPPPAVADPVDDLRTMGLWQAYTERGDGSFNRYGDVSSQVNINNGTIGRSLDYYAQATGDPALAAFAEHARQYRDPSPLYHSVYRWILPATYDPSIAKPAGYDPAEPGACLDEALPNAMLFGEGAMDFAVMRQGWEDGDTQISFKAGDYLAHHGHYDQGTFTLFKNDPLVINSGGYGPYSGDHRLNYYVRTVAVNSILIQRPDEQWTPPGPTPPSGWANDGGQRIIDATGSDVESYEDWLANKTAGQNYESGDVTAFDNVDEEYTYVSSDLTRAYNSTLYDSEGQGGKVSQVTRQMVYLQDSDTLIVFDRVESTDPNYKKKWLLHTPNKFVGGTEAVAVGAADNGIIEVDGDTIPDDVMTMTNGDGKLFLQVLLPGSYTVNKVGGTDYRYYVESDGNDADGYDGQNMDGYDERSWHDYGNWRIEVSPADLSRFDTFLNVLTPRSAATGSVPLGEVLLDDAEATVMAVGDDVVGFGTAGTIDRWLSYTLPAGGAYEHLIADLYPNRRYEINNGQGVQYIHTNDQGVLWFTETAPGAHEVSIQPNPIPEPLTALLLAAGSMGLLRRRR